MIQRKPEDSCLLCAKAPADRKGSHLVPAGLLKSMIGNRSYEEGYAIEPSSDDPIRGFFGRNNLQNTNTAITPNEFVADHIFCTACEKRLAVVENEIQPYILQKYLGPKQRENFPETSKGTYAVIKGLRIPPKRLAVFFYGIALRLSIQYFLKTGQKLFLPEQHHELIRKHLDEAMDVDRKQFFEKAEKFPDWPFLLISSRSSSSQLANVVIPHPEHMEPYCFWMNDFVFIFSFSIEKLVRFRGPNEFGTDINDGSAINSNGATPAFTDVSAFFWDRANDIIRTKAMGAFQDKRLTELSQKHNIDPKVADTKIRALADKIHAESGKGYATCYDEAFKLILSE